LPSSPSTCQAYTGVWFGSAGLPTETSTGLMSDLGCCAAAGVGSALPADSVAFYVEEDMLVLFILITYILNYI